MPVFHTKTIEAILEPVAQQVSQLVILHEESESGTPIPDLSVPIQAVGAAVQHLIVVGQQTLKQSKDKVLKQEMPVAFQRVEESSKFLIEASILLKQDPFSKEAKKKLINGARGILSGTSTLLLTFDDAEVRKILKSCKSLLEYLRVSELVETMPDLITFVKNLTPGVTETCKMVDGRQADLTHQVHRDLLIKHTTSVKKTLPLLISAMKAFVTTLERGGQGRAEAQENRNFLITRIIDDILEIMRVLQLKVYDEEEAEDPTTEMRKAQGIIVGKMDQARDWLSNPSADANGLGERAIRDILKQARSVGEASNDPRINKVCTELDQLMDNLSAYRARGQGNSPEALRLAEEIGKRLEYLQVLVDDAISKEAASGKKLPAPTTKARLEQALMWIDDPTGQKSAIGQRAVSVLLMEGRQLAETLEGPERHQLLATCDNVQRLTKELADLKARGMGHTPQAMKIAQQLKVEMEKLQNAIQKAAVRSVIEHYMDPVGHLNALEKAANAPPGQPNRDADFEERAGAFEHSSKLMTDTAEQVASAGGSTSRHLKDTIKSKVREIRMLTPQISHAGKLLLASNGDPTAAENFKKLKEEWKDQIEELTGLVDMATDASDFIKESEDVIKKDCEAAEIALKQGNLPLLLTKSSRIARCTNRIVQVARGEVENLDDPKFKNEVGAATEQLSERVSPLILSAKAVAQNPNDAAAKEGYLRAATKLKEGVADLRKVFIPDAPDISKLNISDASPSRPPPPRPPLPSEEAIKPSEAQKFEAVLRAPPADNRMAVAAHHLHSEATKWAEEGNAIIQAAKNLALLFAKMSKFVSEEDGEQSSKKELIDTAKLIAINSQNVVKLARQVADECPDKRLKQVLLQTVERIPTTGTQLKILATVKATMFGARDAQADQEATEMLVGCAENLMSAVRQTVKETEAASVKIRGPSWQWTRS
ncbi:vinculin-like [Rhopilema esculentum]|uniref:vinculin-like n=1 Tax=Rhopilema esculentum TaxID=499914 RepID=UPI0031D520E2